MTLNLDNRGEVCVRSYVGNGTRDEWMDIRAAVDFELTPDLNGLLTHTAGKLCLQSVQTVRHVNGV